MCIYTYIVDVNTLSFDMEMSVGAKDCAREPTEARHVKKSHQNSRRNSYQQSSHQQSSQKNSTP